MKFKKYPDDYNPILEYNSKIQNGEIVACEKLKKTFQKIVHDIENPNEFFYSQKRANHVLEFFENYCHHSKGKMGGKLVELELWEKAILCTIFGFVNIEGVRKYQRAVLIVGKKNGKSLLASGVGLYLQIADSEAGAEVYAVATKRDQAKIIWLEAKKMVKKSPMLARKIKPLVSELNSDFNDSVFKPLSSDSDTLDGLNVHGALLDEIHQWKNGKELYDIITDGITAREQPLVFITSTAGTVREDIYDTIYDEGKRTINGYFDENGYKDERSIFFIYELDSRKEWINPNCWIKANPGLGTIKNERTLAEKVEKAKKNPNMVRNLVCKEFNIPETNSQAWLNFEQLNNTDTFDINILKPRYFVGGADLSSTTDLTSAKAIFKIPNDEHIYVLSMYWIAEDLVEKRVQEDKIPYDLWIEQGYIRTTQGNRVHAKYITEWFKEVQDDLDIYPFAVGYDSWSATYWVEDMKNTFGNIMIAVHQGKKTLSSPMKSLGADLESKIINYNNNPIDKWCFANVSYEEDKNNNIQPCKTSKATRRIDGFASLLDAYVVLEDKKEEYESLI